MAARLSHKENFPMTGLLRCAFLGGLTLLAWPISSHSADACPFCDSQGATLVSEAAMVDLIVVGSLQNAKEGSKDEDDSTDLVIDAIVKDPNGLATGKKSVTLPRYLPDINEGKYRYLVYCNTFKNKLDPYKIVPVRPGGDVAKYLKGMVEMQDKKTPVEKRLVFAFDYLDNPDIEISNDAYKEFANADYKEYAGIARSLPADRIAKWMDDKNTPPFRLGLYGSMLGHCGTDKHADLLRRLVDDPDKRVGSGVDGILAGYVMLKPKAGWEYVRGVLGDRKNDFMFRYASLRAARFLHDFRKDLVSQDEVAKGIARLIRHNDIADLAIEDLRKWNRWEMTDQVLELKDKCIFDLFPHQAYETPIVRRAILRFALSAKGNEKAAAYVAEQRKLNPAAVKDAEELLRLEQEPSK